MQPLADKECLLERFPGKGGWTFAWMPEIVPDASAHFGQVKVYGTIDGHEIKAYHLMPMGNGSLFLPVKAEIRKKIKKQAGDYVHVVLYKDDSVFVLPDDLKSCLAEEPGMLEAFLSRKVSEQKACAEWIFAAKREDTRVERIVMTMRRLDKNEKLA